MSPASWTSSPLPQPSALGHHGAPSWAPCVTEQLPSSYLFYGSQGGQESACQAGDSGLIPGLGRSPGGGDGHPLQCSCLENPMDRGAWWAPVHGVAKSWTRLSDWTATAAWFPHSGGRMSALVSRFVLPSPVCWCNKTLQPGLNNRTLFPVVLESEAWDLESAWRGEGTLHCVPIQWKGLGFPW